MHPPLTLHKHPMCAEKVVKRKANFEKSKEFKEQLRVFRKENAASSSQ
ncbi:unnamed protein product [Lathyrus oleraceus]